MGHTLLCVLGLLLLNTPLYGQNEDQNDEQEEGAKDSGAKAILESPAFTLFEGDSVILRCKHPTTRNEAKATFFKGRSTLQKDPNHQPAEMAIFPVSVSHKGWYKCKFDEGAESESRQLKVKERRRQVTLTADKTIIPEGGDVKLTCSLEDPTDLNYEWFRRTSDSSDKLSLQTENVNEPDRTISAGGNYTCRGWRREPDVSTPESNAVIIQEIVPNTATVTLQPNWPQIYSSEKITLRCDIEGGGNTGWTYEWRTPRTNTLTTHEEYIISESHSGEYRCMGRRGYTFTQWSDAKTLTVSANKPKAVLRADNKDIPVGGSVTLTCSVDPSSSSSSSSSGWKYYVWYRGETSSKPLTTQGDQFSVSQGGVYWCRGERGETVYYTDYSDQIYITENIPNTATVTLHPNWPQIYSSEKITLRCDIEGGGNTGWTYEWRTPRTNTLTTHEEYIISESHSGEYRCMGRRGYTFTQWSDAKTLTVSANKPNAVLSPDNKDIPVGGSVTLTCSVNPSPSSGWKYFWYRGETSSKPLTTQGDQISVSQGGVYWCIGGRGEPVYYTDYSDQIYITENIPNTATVTLQPNWPQIYSSEKITLRCDIEGGGNTGWTYEWRTPRTNTLTTHEEYIISESHSGEYRCMGRRGYTFTQWSDAKTLTVSANKPKAVLRADNKDIPVGGSVTLTCSVDPSSSSSSSSSGWKYYVWYRGETSSKPLTTQGDQFSVSQGGVYWCRGERGETVYYTDYSDQIYITENIPNTATVTLHPNWPQIYSSEKITLRCDIEGGGNTGWTYEWRTPRTNTLTTHEEYIISESHSGEYRCMGRRGYTFTQWSDAKTLTVSANKPNAVLSPDNKDIPVGGSVTLTCSVNPSPSSSSSSSSSGWKYFWYRGETSSKPLTTQGDQISVSQGGVYWCIGGRGEPVYYTDYSDQIYITENIPNTPIVTLHPNWPQIYISEKITLRCEIQGGGDTDWTYEWRTPSPNTPTTHKEYSISSATESHSGEYSCRGRSDYNLTQWSDAKTLTVLVEKPKPSLTFDPTPRTLTCSVKGSADWEYDWFRQTSDSSIARPMRVGVPNKVISVSEAGLYHCRGGRGDPRIFTEDSDAVAIHQTLAIKATVTLQPNWPLIYISEKITLRCASQGDGNTGWTYEWKSPGSNTLTTHEEYVISSATMSHSGGYSCRGRRDYSLTQWSYTKTLRVLANKPKAVLRADNRDIPVGGSVTLTCSVNPSSSSGWKYFWYRGETSSKPLTTQGDVLRLTRQFRVSQGGLYRCRGERGEPVYYTDYSDSIHITKSVPNRATVTLQPNWPLIYRSEKITLRCEIQGGGDTDWTYEWRAPRTNTPTTQKEFSIRSATMSHSGEYSCMGRRDYSLTQWSVAKTLTVLAYKPEAVLSADNRDIPVEGSVTLTCSVYPSSSSSSSSSSSGWKYYFWYRGETPSETMTTQGDQFSVSQGGLYRCRGGRGGRGWPVYYTDYSDPIHITKNIPNRPTVTLQPNRLQIYSSEKITLRCDIQGGGNTEWTYEWRAPSPNTRTTHREYIISSATLSHGGEYSCMGRSDYSLTQWSDAKTLTVIAYKPKAVLRADNRDIPVGGSVTLTCSVNPSSSSGWKYFWYRGETSSKPLTTQDVVLLLNGQIRVSQGGLYRCRGERGETVYYTDYSYPIHITKKNAKEAVVTLHPIWTEIYKGETITLRCEVKNGGDTEWEYEWTTTASSDKLSKQNEHIIRKVSASHSGTYRCKGRMKSAEWSSTAWSEAIRLTVYNNPKPVLTVFPLWLSPGDSVTLNCSVRDPSAGWRFYWYKAVPKLSDNSYSYELLPGSTNGTEQDSYIVHGQTRTAGYVCRAGRGDPVFYTPYSEHKFAWSGDVHSSASLTVSPDRVQHFTSDSVSLNCEGNSTKWRVRKFTEQSYLTSCSNWGTMTGSTCNIGSIRPRDTSVYWCESGSGEFSNAVNITTQGQHIILASPVYPVTEGDSVSLSCKLRWDKFASNVFFYRNGELIQNDTRWELNISAVSKSDEGFYKCQCSQQVSPESWMSVKGSRPGGLSFPVPLIIGLVCGIILLLLLLLLYRYKPSKDSCFIRPIRSESTDRGSATSHVVYQNEAEGNECSSPLDDGADPQEVIYSLIEFKNIGKKRKQHEPEESVIYSDVRTGTADNLMYAQVNCHSKGKAKKNNGKSTPEATDETLYSEFKPGPALGL
ncbi:uncharacterized protein LOC141760374 [Sebastes fasciatus]|uniref:uncharacterized protein LOC141760374 n=1 Tax=Sebastes fasciatus TaxID=394691 RepID=UPI003D9F0DF6